MKKNNGGGSFFGAPRLGESVRVVGRFRATNVVFFLSSSTFAVSR